MLGESQDDRMGGRWVFGVGLVALAVTALWEGRGLPIFSDEWDIIAFHFDGHYLTPYNGHLSAVPIVLYQGVLHTLGMGSSTPFRALGLVGYVAVAVLVFRYARSRVRGWVATILALWFAWNPHAEMNLLYGFLVNFSLPLAALLVIWSLHDSATPTERGSSAGGPLVDAVGGVILLVALASSSVGTIVAFAVLADLALRRTPLRRWAPYVLAVAVWAAWYVHDHEPLHRAAFADTAHYAGRQIIATLAAFSAGWTPGAWLVGATLLIVAIAATVRWRTMSPRAIACGAAWLAFVVLTAVSRAGDIALNPPDAGRYVWVGMFFLVLFIAETLPPAALPPLPALIGAGAVVLLGALALVGNARDYRSMVVDYGATMRAPVGVVQVMPHRIDRARILPLNLIPVRVRDLDPALRAVGQPYPSLTFANAGNDEGRRTADQWMISDLPLEITASGSSSRGCRSFDGPAHVTGGETIEVAAGPDAPADVSARRFMRAFDLPPVGTVPAGRRGHLRIPRDRSRVPWQVVVAGAGAHAEICP